MAGQIAEIARDTRARLPHRPTPLAARVLLVEAGERVLPGSRRRCREGAARALERLGVTPLLEHTVDRDRSGAVTIAAPPTAASSGIAARTVDLGCRGDAVEPRGLLAEAARRARSIARAGSSSSRI